ncbi:MAG TPA: 3'-5' exonuclease, partial [Kofleriaceae bacterium]|nr:3'-5' exonuclease [Kofleriaceae bacterium]
MEIDATCYLVVDLEATCDDLGAVPRHESEIIEIGAVLIDGHSLRTVAELMMFVRPTLHPVTPFCTRLTTITHDDVEAAPGFVEAAARLAVFGRGALFCSWGNYDRNQLARDAERHRIPPPLPDPHWNLKERFSKMRSTRKRYGMDSALAELGLEA